MDEEWIHQTINTVIIQPTHVTLTKNTKGYQWEISVHADGGAHAVAEIVQIDTDLKARFGSEEAKA